MHQFKLAEEQSSSELQVDCAGVSIGRVPIIREVTFNAHAGEFTAIIGPSGSGKTTLLKAMTGELAYSGSIRLAGLETGKLSAEYLARLRGVLPQASQISFPLNVSEVVGLGVIDRRRGRDGRTRRIADALAKVGLHGFEGRSYQELSGGEQQRVQLARVLCQVWEPVAADGQPRWLFLDEPVSSLDIKHQFQIMRLAAGYAAAGGGVVAVMHDLNLTAAFADRILVMKNGKRLTFGVRDDVMRADLLSDAYDFPLALTRFGDSNVPLVVPAPGSAQ
ncbi:heme ABC transporter ATP-binding protein [Roseibium marinum]|uniref:Iron complex transport system ATP-binding protein n=1 Tax=Roseibium marinum TaxID=281252 RepID=A0A2S3UKZ7_9HYPH|nr:heme ABC transporter ATP-binding protein [Roseibium marinum]POF28384.1 iron complex transport system ATP-binding protein [Roseibium marinum]